MSSGQENGPPFIVIMTAALIPSLLTVLHNQASLLLKRQGR
jgi:hypothetical protein